MKVKDVAVKETYCASPTMSLTEISAMMKRHGVGAMPVCDEDRLVGMITDRDIVISPVAAGMDASACRAREFMTSNPVSISPDTGIEEAARIMSNLQGTGAQATGVGGGLPGGHAFTGRPWHDTSGKRQSGCRDSAQDFHANPARGTLSIWPEEYEVAVEEVASVSQ